jgi:hypothetical protein
MRSIVAASLVLAATAPAVYGSGGDGFTESQLMPENHVASSELKSFASGNVGVLAGSYWHIYQVLAYRALTGHTVAADELDAIGIDGWYVKRYANSDDSSADSAAGNWMGARQQIKSAKAVPDVNTVKDDGNYGSFLNCANDAFATAGATLADRLKTGGANWAAVWLAGQDAVFANCGMVGDGPQRKNAPFTAVPALPAGAPAWLAADHNYQVAAAFFYAQKYDDAHTAFQAIAKDDHSPWQKYGSYMAARSLIRKASLTTFDKDADANLAAHNKTLDAARADLVAALPSYPAAQAMINYVDVRLHPAERTATLSAKLATAKFGAATEQDLADYLALLDTAGYETDPKDAMTNWINAMQMSTADSVYSDVEGKPDGKQLNTTHSKALALSRKWWASTHETQWLVAVLANLRKGEATDAELKAAAGISASSNAQPTLQYHLARLALVGGHPAEADTIVTAALAKSNLSTSTRNRWLHLQLLSASTLDGFVAAIPRHTVDDSKPDAIPNEQDTKAAASGEPDADFGRALYRDMPLDVLMQIYQHAKLGDQRHEDLAEKIWTRAVILGDWAMADSLNGQLIKGRDTTAHLYTRFQGAKTDKERKLDATLIMVNTPELDPNSIPPGDKPSQWDCQNSVFASDSLHDDPELAQVKPAFLTAAQKAEGGKQGKTFGALPVRTTYLAPVLLEWARTKPDDPEAPKALHFFVASTRPVCQHEGSGGVSKEAFKLLHAQWPKDEWTKKTPYFY